jgi:hypothetical protein
VFLGSNRRTLEMSHVSKQLPWCSIDVDTKAGQIIQQERWQYTWLVSPPFRRWTPAEMQAFHQKVDRVIWAAWSNRAFLSVSGASAFAKRFSGRSVPVFMDVRRVLAKGHWTVFVTKVPEGRNLTSTTNWVTRSIQLDSNDIAARVRCVGPVRGVCMTQMPVAHEFGHAVGNSRFAGGGGDEYPDRSQHTLDLGSMMNRGIELRNRHFDHLLAELTGIIPDTTFALASLI